MSRAEFKSVVGEMVRAGKIKVRRHQAEIFRHLAGRALTVIAAIEWESQVVVITAF